MLDAESYEEIMDSMNAVAQEARKGTASVSVVSAEQDWNTEATGIRPSVTGVITADNGQELLILADDSLCGEGDAWNVHVFRRDSPQRIPQAARCDQRACRVQCGEDRNSQFNRGMR